MVLLLISFLVANFTGFVYFWPTFTVLGISAVIVIFVIPVIKDKRLLQKNPEFFDDITKFVSTYLPENSWVNEISIPEEDIDAFHTIERSKGVNISKRRLAIKVEVSADEEVGIRFSGRFKKLNPSIFNELTEKSIVKAYVSTFENNYEYVELLRRFAKSVGIITTDWRLRNIIDKEIDKRAHQRKVDKISSAMKNGENISHFSIENIDELTGIEFEHLLGKLFTAMGYKSVVTKASGDQGADLIIEKFGEKTVVQAKRYSGSVSNSAVQEAVAAQAHYNCNSSMVVTNSFFTKSAIELAESNSVSLYDRERLNELLVQYL